MAKAETRGYVSLECADCGRRTYRTSVRLKGNPYKVDVQKYCPGCRKHTLHKEKKK